MNIQKKVAVFALCAVLLTAMTALTACASGGGGGVNQGAGSGANAGSGSGSGDNSGSNSGSGEGAGSNNGQSPAADSLWAAGIDTVTLDDKKITEADFEGNDLTVLNVWATWCPPCVGELPHLQEMSERFADQKVQIVGVLEDGVTASGAPDSKVTASAQTLLADAGANYLVILPDDTLRSQLIDSMQYFPTTFFVDANGKVVHTVVGAKDANAWEKEINAVLASIA